MKSGIQPDGSFILDDSEVLDPTFLPPSGKTSVAELEQFARSVKMTDPSAVLDLAVSRRVFNFSNITRDQALRIVRDALLSKFK